MPSNKEWGPIFWTLLHGLAERLGNQVIDTMAADEAREMIFVLKGVEAVMPCEKCRTHYHDFKKTHPLEAFSERRGPHFRVAVREWLWQLHEAVNVRNGAASFPIDNLTPQYKHTDIAATWQTLFKYLQTSVANGLIVSEHLKAFRRHLSLLRATLGV
jgi:hypothetical protein